MKKTTHTNISFFLVRFHALIEETLRRVLCTLFATRNSGSTSRNWPTIRYGLRSLFTFMTGISIVMAAGWYCYSIWSGNYGDFARRISTVKGIQDLHLWGDEEEGRRDVETLIFRIAGKPDSYVEISKPTIDVFENADSIRLRQIGDKQLSVGYSDAPRKRGMTADIGPESELKSILPFTVTNLDELITRYDEIEAYFNTWPVYPDVGELVVSSTRTIEYHRTK